MLFKNFDDRRAVYSGAIGKDALLEFVQRYAVPLVVEFNHETAQKIFSGEVKSHFLLFSSTKADDYEAKVNKFKDYFNLNKFYWQLIILHFHVLYAMAF